jgi:hypothetical protein
MVCVNYSNIFKIIVRAKYNLTATNPLPSQL